jgi:four helix bundle protein
LLCDALAYDWGMQIYRDLNAWKKAVFLVLEIYKSTEGFPKHEQYGLTNQIRRAAVSIPSNIAEGYLRKHKQDYIRFVRIAFASGGELETQLYLAKQLGFLSEEKYKQVDQALSEVMKMLNKLLQALEKKYQ